MLDNQPVLEVVVALQIAVTVDHFSIVKKGK
jgi:hypothetical protein